MISPVSFSISLLRFLAMFLAAWASAVRDRFCSCSAEIRLVFSSTAMALCLASCSSLVMVLVKPDRMPFSAP